VKPVSFAWLGIALVALTSGAAAEPRLADERVLLRTNFGDLVLVLYPEAAPKHVEQVLRLTKLGIYDSIPILRVQPDFVIQLSVVENRREPLTGAQRAAIQALPLEIDPSLKHHRGVLSMAHGGDPNSGRSSFAILLGDAPDLDGKFTIFGRVEKGFDVLDAIKQVRVDFNHVPIDPVEVVKAQVASEAQLQKMTLSGVALRDSSAIRIPTHTVFALVLVLALALATALLAGRAPPRMVTALGLLIVLVAFLALYSGLMPYARGSRWLSAVLFLGAIGLFRLMGRFENPS
jgi:cyclophilin family peptidyl-prolyl cis-trans isomerase